MNTERPNRNCGDKTKPIFWFFLLFLLLAGIIGVGWWRLEHRLDSLQLSLLQLSQRADSLSAQIQEVRKEATEAAQRATRAEESALLAARQRLRAEEARTEAEKKAIEAQRAAQQLQLQAIEARRRAEEAQKELEEIRKRREAELDRIQQVLSKIVETHRTPDGMVIRLSGPIFTFDFDSAELKPHQRELLSRIAGVLLATGGYRLYIYGHTDDIGTEEYNLNLSERRARAVADYLIQAGIDPSIITVKGFGKSSALVPGTSKEARAKNRRVEIGLVDTIIHYQNVVSERE